MKLSPEPGSLDAIAAHGPFRWYCVEGGSIGDRRLLVVAADGGHSSHGHGSVEPPTGSAEHAD
jgi:hypothetical protein